MTIGKRQSIAQNGRIELGAIGGLSAQCRGNATGFGFEFALGAIVAARPRTATEEGTKLLRGHTHHVSIEQNIRI